MIAQGIVDYDIDELEYAFLAKDAPKEGEDLPLYIPILMPRMSNEEAYTRRRVIDNKFFVNASECAPDVPTSMYEQNFLSVPRHPDLELKRFLKGADVKEGSRVMLHIINKSIDNMYVIRQM